MSFLAYTRQNLNRCSDEAGSLAQSAFGEAVVTRIEESRRGEHETRGLTRGLGAKENAGPLTATQWVGVCDNELAEKGVELFGRDTGLPAFGRSVEGAHSAVCVPVGLRDQIDVRRPLDLN